MLVLGFMMGASAEVVYDDFGGTPLTYSFGTTPLSTAEETVVELDLPGGKKATIIQFYYDNENFFQIHSVDVKQNLVGSFFYAGSAEANQTWSAVSSNGTNGWGNISALSLLDYSTEHLRENPTYIPFRFEDTTASNALKYGYINCSTELSGSGSNSVLTLTIYSYAYETDGSEIAMGAQANTSDPSLLYDTYPVNLGEFVNPHRIYESMMDFWRGHRVATPFSYADGEYVVSNVTLYAGHSSGDVDDLHVGIYASTTNGVPGELLLRLNNPTSMGGVAEDQAFTCSSQVVLSAGTTYWVIIAPSMTALSAFSVYLSQNSLNDLKRSHLYASGSSWGSWLSNNKTVAMKIYGAPPPVQYELSASSGPVSGSNSVTITTTNDVFGSGSDITNVTVGGVAATITGQSATSVTITLPPGSAGVQDIVIVSTSAGSITLPGAYTYNPAGVIWDPEFIAGGGPYLSGGDYHSMALKADGSIAAWGYTDYGQLDVPAPNSEFIAVSAGAAFSMGLKADGTISAWGRNFDRQATVPAPNSNFVAISAGDIHSLGLKADGSVVGWGTNTLGQLDVPAPNSNFVAVAAGYSGYSLGLKADGRIVGWGRNDYDQLNVPVPNTHFVAMAAGHRHALGLKDNGTIVVWGNNAYGQLELPAPNTHFVAVAAGALHSLGLKSDGTIVAWGHNSLGQLNVPSPNADFVAIAVGNYHSLGLKADGTIVSWGDNRYGALNVPDSTLDFGLFEYGVTPGFGGYTGGYEVVISGTNLCDGTPNDITSVTLCGVTGSVVSVSGSTQIVVRAGAAATIGRGDARVVSTSFGTTVQSRAFTYQRVDQAPLLFAPQSPQAYRERNPLSTSGGSGMGAVSYKVISGPGTIHNGTELYVSAGSGTIVIRATKAQDDLFYATSADATVEAIRGTAIITLDDLLQFYDGTPKSATVRTDPSGMPVGITYDGSAMNPTEVGSYTVVATVDLANWEGSTTGMLTIIKEEDLQSTKIRFLPNGQVLLEFASMGDRHYEIEYMNDFPTGLWQTVLIGPLEGGTDQVQWIDEGPPMTLEPSGVRVYRMRVLLP